MTKSLEVAARNDLKWRAVRACNIIPAADFIYKAPTNRYASITACDLTHGGGLALVCKLFDRLGLVAGTMV